MCPPGLSKLIPTVMTKDFLFNCMPIFFQFSLPMPQGGRDAITKNPILREDQLPQKVLHPKSKKSNKQVTSPCYC
jgi:hypothetical protein